MSDLFDDDFRYSALSVAYSIAALISGFVPSLTLSLGAATGNAWWHPGVVLAVMSAITLVGAIAAARMSPRIPAGTEAIEAEVGEEPLAATAR